MKRTIARVLLACFGALLLHGCALEPAPHYESHFGEAVNAAKAQMIMHPDASRNADPVSGVDGTPAVTTMGRYQKSFEAPPPTFTVINIGGGGGQPQ